MGLLSLGTPLHWNESKKYSEHVRDNGIIQLLNSFKAAKGRKNDKFYWGDEIEYMLIKIDDENKNTRLAIGEDQILDLLGEEGLEHHLATENDILFHPEYGRFMLEATPLKPYDGESLGDFLKVEGNMSIRRKIAITKTNDKSIIPLTLTTYPRMGVEDFCYPSVKTNGSSSKSLFLPDEIINRHVRFPTLTANIRRRRGAKVSINIPLFKDVNTRKDSEVDPTIPKRDLFPFSDNEAFQGAARPGHIYMDSMGFGMGSSCLQVTMQAKDIFEARFLYDSLINIAPLMLSVTSAAPIFRGQLADQDVRWNVISNSVDDRTPFERSENPLPNHFEMGGITDLRAQENLERIPKPRYDSVDQYLGDLIGEDGNDVLNEKFGYFKEKYNDIYSPINEKVFKILKSNGFDNQLSKHFAHLFIRDPIVIFSESINQNNETEMDHFENIQSTNWQTLRFKVPTQSATPNEKNAPGWRVELRPMEISITDFENAAYSVFSILLSKAILKYKPNFYLPISFVEENMHKSHKRDSTIKEKFNFRININDSNDPIIEQLTLNEIFNGCPKFEGGLIFLVKKIAKEDFGDSNEELILKLDGYLELVSKRASGEIKTTAKFIREFVSNHKDYKKDSMVSDLIVYDLCSFAKKLSNYDHDSIKLFFGDELSSWMIENGY